MTLWSASGAILASAPFTSTSSTPEGWQEVLFASPVAITANQTYIASYHAPGGHYSVNGSYFMAANQAAFTRPPLRALVSGEDGPNGVFSYGGPQTFPTSSFGDSNYWVDVVFDLPANQPPVATHDAYSTNEDTELAVAAPGIVGNDSGGGGPLTAVVVEVPAHGSLVPHANGSFSYTPAPDFHGTDSFTYRATDGTLTSEPATVTITITAVNDAPFFEVVGNQAVAEDAGAQTVAITGVSPGPASEASQSVTLTATSNNPALIPHPAVTGSGASRTLSYQPAANGNGTATITVTANDGQTQNATSARTFTITVNAVNDVPTISNVADQMTAGGTAVGPLAVTIGDVETAAASLSLSRTSSNPVLVPLGNIVFGGAGAARTVKVTPAAGQSGSATITLTVSDGSLTASDTFVLTVKTPTTTSRPISSRSTSTYGQSVTFATTVSGAGGTPTGTVTFFDNGVALGTATLSEWRIASLTTSTVNAGTRSITATYNGDSRFAASTSAAFTQTVNKAAATTTLAAPSPLQQQYSDRVALSATISVPGAAGSVTFKIGTVALGTASIDATGKASLNPQLLGSIGTGEKSVTATFNTISPNYTVTNPAGRSISILRENAQFAWPGPKR